MIDFFLENIRICKKSKKSKKKQLTLNIRFDILLVRKGKKAQSKS